MNDGLDFLQRNAALVGSFVGVLLCFLCWGLIRNAVTAAHEAGHAVVALCLGGQLSSIRIRFDTSGETQWLSERSRLCRGLCAAAGYPAPMALGLLLAWLLGKEWARWGLLGCAVLCVLSIPLWRGAWTVVVGVLGAVVLGVGTWFGGTTAAALTGAVIAISTVGGLRAAGEAIARTTTRGDGSDVAVVAASFFLPVFLSKLGLAFAALALGSLTGWLILR